MFVQPLLTVEQSGKIAELLGYVTSDPERAGVAWADEAEETLFTQLAGFFQIVTEHPEQFRPAGAMATTARGIARRLKGPAQPPTGKRDKRTQGQQKRDRKAQRETVADYSQARERVEADMTEAREFYEAELATKQTRVTELLTEITAAGTFGGDSSGGPALIELLELIGADALAAQARVVGK